MPEENIVLWLEDRPDTVFSEINWVKNQGFDVKIVATLFRCVDLLKQNLKKVPLIILDIMLYRILDLKSIGVKDAKTNEGYDAGWVFLDIYLRKPENIENEFVLIPVLILSSRKLNKENEDLLNDLKSREGHGPIDYIEKGGIDIEGKQTWKENFRTKFIELVNLGVKK